MKKISLAQPKKVEVNTPQNSANTTNTKDELLQKLKESGERRNGIMHELKEIADKQIEKKDSDGNGGSGGLPSGMNIQILIVMATAAITYFSQKEEEENNEILSRLSELVAQYAANPIDTTIKEIRELVAKATEIKQNETGKGFEDLIGKSGIGIMAELAKSTDSKGSLSDALESLKKMQSSKSKDLNI